MTRQRLRLHAKVGTHPACYIELYGRHPKSLGVGSQITFRNPETGRIATGIIREVRDVLDEPLYFLELI